MSRISVQVDWQTVSHSVMHTISQSFYLSILGNEVKAMLVVYEEARCCSVFAHCNTHTHFTRAHTQQRSTAKVEVYSGNNTPNKPVTHSFLHMCLNCARSLLRHPDTADPSHSHAFTDAQTGVNAQVLRLVHPCSFRGHLGGSEHM